MRRFQDGEDREWTVAVASGSYGAMTLMFSPAGDARICWVALEATTAAEAQDMLTNFSDDELRVRLATAEVWGR